MKKLLLLFSLLLLFNCGGSEPNESNAKQAARAAIMQNLKNPLDLKFHHNESVLDLGYHTYEYKETITAKNSFAGAIKQNAVVQVKWIKDDPNEVSNWTVVNIRFY